MPSFKRNQGLCIFPGYHWCGPGCSGPGAPINDVDECCRKHDKCLESHQSQCKCDQAFLKCLRPKVNYNTEKGKKAAIMYNYMELQTIFTCRINKTN
jgi:hypothetical protein